MMNMHLPDYRSKEDGVLYIIGNGFDLYHGLNTRYSDFHDWLIDKYPDFVVRMQKIYPKTNPKALLSSRGEEYILWSDFEKALSFNAKLSELHHSICNEEVPDYNSLPSEKQQTVASEKVRETLKQVSPLLKKWVETFSDKYKELKKLLPLGYNSKYITFNYTRVLEEVYEIEGEEHVWHIHGSVCDENVVTGHDDNLQNTDVPGSSLEEISERNIRRELENMRKPTDKIFQNRPASFKDMSKINTIIVIGHSLADVDIPYFRYLLASLPEGTDIEWQFWVHNKEGEKIAQERVKELCVRSDFKNIITKIKWKYLTMDDWEEIERLEKERSSIDALEQKIFGNRAYITNN